MIIVTQAPIQTPMKSPQAASTAASAPKTVDTVGGSIANQDFKVIPPPGKQPQAAAAKSFTHMALAAGLVSTVGAAALIGGGYALCHGSLPLAGKLFTAIPAALGGAVMGTAGLMAGAMADDSGQMSSATANLVVVASTVSGLAIGAGVAGGLGLGLFELSHLLV